MAFHERLRAEIPASLVDLLRIPGVGPKTVRAVYEGLGIETLDDLRAAAEAGRLRGLKGISARDRAAVLEGIAQLESRPPDAARPGPGDRRRPRRAARRARRACAGSSRRARCAVAARRSATSTCSSRPTTRRRRRSSGSRRSASSTGSSAGAAQGGRQAAARPAGGPDGHAARRGRHVPRPLHRARRSTTSGCGGSPATAAGACPRRASCASTTTASR